MAEKKSPRLIWLTPVVLLAAVLSVAPGKKISTDAPYLRLVRTIETNSFAVPHPSGLTYIPQSGVFAYLSIPDPPENGGQKNLLMLVSFAGEPQGTVALAEDLANTLNISFSPLSRRLFLFNDGSQELVEYSLNAEGRPDPNTRQQFTVGHFGVIEGNGMTIDPESGDLFILDGNGGQILRVRPALGNPSDGGASYQAGELSRITVKGLPRGSLRGLAFNPVNGYLYLLHVSSRRLFGVSTSGQVMSERNLKDIPFQDPCGLVFAPSGDRTDNPENISLYLTDCGLPDTRRPGQILEICLTEPFSSAKSTLAPLALDPFQSTLVRTIRTSDPSPPSPDTAGLAFHSSNGTIFYSDSEVNEVPIFEGYNYFEMNIGGSLIGSMSTLGFGSKEPTGMAYNATNGHMFISDDDRRRVYEVNPGGDGLFGTSDDQITSIDTTRFNSFDPEGIAFDSSTQTLYIVDGVNNELYAVRPGNNGVFNGIPPDGDDLISQFDTAAFGMIDPEGIELDVSNGHLYLVGHGSESLLTEISTDGTLLREIDVSAANAVALSGLARAPSSYNSQIFSIYICDRGIDNSADPDENDGRIYEMTLPESESDDEPPVVTAFNLPGTSASLTVPILTFTATDDVGVTGYLATESSSTPAAGASGWSASPPTQYSFASGGNKTLYGWAKDAAGNVSTALSDTVVITLSDTTAPTVTAFDLPATSTSLTVPILTFTATDNVGVTGYLATESSSKPAAGASGWSTSPPTQYTFASGGTKTLYGWAKDAAGNVSTALSDTVNISTGSGQQQVIESRVSASSDDAEQTSSSGSVSLTSSDLELGADGGKPQTVGMRFANLNLPQGATIVEAYIQFTVDETDSGATSVVIRGQAADNAATFTSSNSNLTTRPLTTASATWEPAPWTVLGQAGTDQRTPNLAPIIQEIASRPGWVSGNALVILIAGSGERTAESFEGAAAAAPLLHLVYQTGGSSDTTAPTVTAFDLPSTSTSLAVPILSFTATDNVGVTGYLATESSSTPAAGASGWSSSPPTQYSFASEGSKTLYGWAKDAAGNVSTALSDTVVITLADATAPTVTAFDLPSTSDSLTVPILSFTATDNVGVTGYLATESSSTPAAGASGWSSSPPTQYSFASEGSKILYGWAKDAAGNVSTALSDTVVITLADTTVPTVTAFDLPSTFNSLAVPILSFTATDNVGVTGYLATESSSTPAAGASGWSSSPPTQYSFASEGSKTLYGWAKDAAGNVSTALSDTVVIALGRMHVGDLDGSVRMKGKSGKGDASVTVTVHDLNHNPVANAVVSGTWSGAASGTVTGTTDGSGNVTFIFGNLSSGSTVNFGIIGISHGNFIYDASANHDPDGDSDGSSITVILP